MSESKTAGPENLTLTERLISWLPVPFPVGALLLASLTGPPAIYLSNYLDTFDAVKSLERVIFPQPGYPLWRGFIDPAIYFLSNLYMIFAVRYVRRKLVSTEAKLLPLLPGGEGDFHRLFGRVSDPRAAILITGVFLILGLPTFLLGELQRTLGPFGVVQLLISTPLGLVVFGAFFWAYIVVFWGLHKLGQEPLRLKSFYEESMLGLRPVGSLSLALSLVYFGFLGFTVLGTVASTDPLYTGNIVVIAVLVPMVVLGVLLFFLPLRSIHAKMVQVKQREQAAVREQAGQLLRAIPNPGKDSAEDALVRIQNLLALDMAERKVAAIPTWPFDTSILGRLVAIALSVTAILIARMIQIAAGL